MHFTCLGQNINLVHKIAWKGERVCIEAEGVLSYDSLKNSDGDAVLPIKIMSLYATTADGQKVWDVIAPYKAKQPKMWLTIDVPLNAEVGVYHSPDFKIVLEVLSLELPRRDNWSFHLDLWQNPWAVARVHKVAPWSEDHFRVLEKHLMLLADAGQKVITTTVVDNVWASQTFDAHGSMVKWIRNDQGLVFDFSVFIRYVDLCDKVGIRGPIHVFSVLPWGSNQGCGAKDGKAKYTMHNGDDIYTAPGHTLYNQLWSIFMGEFVKVIRKKGWVKRIHFAFDERHEDEMMAALKMLEDVLPYDFKPLRTASAYEYNKKYTDLITDLSPAFNKRKNWNHIAAARRAKGQKTTFYLCEWPKPPSANNFLCSPIHENKWVGWYAAANGLDGFLRWAFDSWPEDPLLSGDFPGPHGHWPAGDTFLSYPHGWGSRRLAMLREGIQDFEKFRVLQRIAPGIVRDILAPFVHEDIIPTQMMKIGQNSLDELSKRVTKTNVTATYYVMRHGDRYDVEHKEEWRRRVQTYGHAAHDTPLSHNGKEQARCVAQWFRDQGKTLDAVYSSPYLRTLQTAEQFGHAIRVESGLCEGWHEKVEDPSQRAQYIPCIDLDYQSVVKARHGELYPDEYVTRVTTCAKHFGKHEHGNMLFVSHAGTSLVFVATLLNIPARRLGKIGVCDVIRIDRFADGTFHLIHKFTPHQFPTITPPWGF